MGGIGGDSSDSVWSSMDCRDDSSLEILLIEVVFVACCIDDSCGSTDSMLSSMDWRDAKEDCSSVGLFGGGVSNDRRCSSSAFMFVRGGDVGGNFVGPTIL